MTVKLPLQDGWLSITPGGNIWEQLRVLWTLFPLLLGSWSLTAEQVNGIFEKAAASSPGGWRISLDAASVSGEAVPK